MNINFTLNGETVTVGHKTRKYFNTLAENGTKTGTIYDQSDNGIEWELCETIGINPGRYVGRISFRYTIADNKVEITASKVA